MRHIISFLVYIAAPAILAQEAVSSDPYPSSVFPAEATSSWTSSVAAIATASVERMASSGTATSTAAPTTRTISVAKLAHRFDPDVTFANVGDTIKFEFYPANHSVVRAEYKYPCVPYEMTDPGKKVGFWSGFRPVDAILPNPPSYTVTINDTDPIFFYCSAPGSCIDWQMIGVINPNANVSLEVQKQEAKDSTYSLSPGEKIPDEAETPLPPKSTSASTAAGSTSTPTAVTSGSSSPTPVPSGSHGLSTGAIVGIVIGGIAVLLIGALLFFFIGRNRTLKEVLDHEKNKNVAAAAAPPPPATRSSDVKSDVRGTVYDVPPYEDYRSPQMASPQLGGYEFGYNNNSGHPMSPQPAMSPPPGRFSPPPPAPAAPAFSRPAEYRPVVELPALDNSRQEIGHGSPH